MDAIFTHLTANPAQGKGGTCFGDSGSSVLYEPNGPQEATILSIVSFVTNSNCAGSGDAFRIDRLEILE